MEVKKSPKADLERTKLTSILMGMVVALAVLFVGFEWSNSDIEIAEAGGVGDIIAEEEVEITRQDNTPPPPPPPPAPVAADILKVVDDDVKLDDVDIVSSEDDQALAQVQNYTPPAVVQEEEEESSQTIFTVVEKMPEFPGGQAALLNYLSKAIKYPIIAQENGLSGRVSIQFTVNKDGSIVDAEVVRGVDPSLDKEALRVINAMPKWKPGEQRGKPVRVKFTVPVIFRLQ